MWPPRGGGALPRRGGPVMLAAMRTPLAVVLIALAGCTQLPPQDVPGPRQPGQPLVVVDIDGTLTPAVLAVSEARPAAAEVLRALVDKGYGLAYLTAREPLAQGGLPDWLRREGFPAGPLHVAQTGAERADPASFKARWLAVYADRGWRMAWAWGDSTSDFEAYARAGFAREQVFALRRRGDDGCQSGVYARCLSGWEEVRAFVAGLAPVR